MYIVVLRIVVYATTCKYSSILLYCQWLQKQLLYAIQRLSNDERRVRTKGPYFGQDPSTRYRGIPASEWSTMVQRVMEQKEPLRTVAAAYGVSHETIRRMLLHMHQQRGQQEA